jgi:hypothetical protein
MFIEDRSYKEIDIQVPAVSKFSVPNLKSDCHSIISV